MRGLHYLPYYPLKYAKPPYIGIYNLYTTKNQHHDYSMTTKKNSDLDAHNPIDLAYAFFLIHSLSRSELAWSQHSPARWRHCYRHSLRSATRLDEAKWEPRREKSRTRRVANKITPRDRCLYQGVEVSRLSTSRRFCAMSTFQRALMWAYDLKAP